MVVTVDSETRERRSNPSRVIKFLLITRLRMIVYRNMLTEAGFTFTNEIICLYGSFLGKKFVNFFLLQFKKYMVYYFSV